MGSEMCIRDRQQAYFSKGREAERSVGISSKGDVSGMSICVAVVTGSSSFGHGLTVYIYFRSCVRVEVAVLGFPS